MNRKLNSTIVLILMLFISGYTNAQKYYSFEVKVPTEWNNVTKGDLTISDNHFKHGRKSLQWNWNAGSVLTVNNPDSLSENCKNAGSAIWT